MTSLLQQIKIRRQALGFKQHDMFLRVGISRQQYQHLEAKGNPRLDTLQLIAKGLNSDLILIPQEKLEAVMAVLDSDAKEFSVRTVAIGNEMTSEGQKNLSDDPWRDLLGDNLYD